MDTGYKSTMVKFGESSHYIPGYWYLSIMPCQATGLQPLADCREAVAKMDLGRRLWLKLCFKPTILHQLFGLCQFQPSVQAKRRRPSSTWNPREAWIVAKMSAQYVELSARNRSPPFTDSDLTFRILLGYYNQVQPRAFSELHLSLNS